MTDAIGRGDYVLSADFTELEQRLAAAEAAIKESGTQAEKTFEEAGKKAGAKFSESLRLGLKVVGAAATGAFALATKGVIELENVTASFRAETGATAAEAKRAGDAILNMSSKNIQPLGEIGRALTKVHTDLGLTGDEAEAVTQRFLRFARATSQDAAASVVAFDDILDAWGLTAKDSGQIMDYLIASNQKYGGSIEANQQALSQLAPQLRALNMDWRDGANLLNLFAEAGVDAGSSQRALNSAIQNLPKGESFEQFIARLALIKDDGARATEAMKVFGTMAGAKMSNAIKPGVTSLDQFGFALDEVEGKTDQAADALDSTFGAQMQLLLKRFGSALTGVGKELGPLLTGFAALASLGGTLGLDTFAKTFGPKLVAAMKGIGQKAGNALADGLSAVWAGAGGTVLGNNIATRIENIVDSSKNSRIQNALKAAGAKAALVWSSAFGLVSGIASPLAKAITESSAAAVVRGALTDAAAASGMLFGSKFGTALKIGLVLGMAAIADDVHAELQKISIFGKGNEPLRDVGKAFEDWNRDMPWPLGMKGAPDWAGKAAETRVGLDQALVQPLKAALGPLPDMASTAAAGIAGMLRSGEAYVRDGSIVLAAAIEHPIKGAASRAATAVRQSSADILADIGSLRDRITAAAAGVAEAIYGPEIAAQNAIRVAREIAEQERIIADKRSTSAQVNEATLRRAALKQEQLLINADLLTYGTEAERIAKTKAFLTSDWWVKAYRNATPEQRVALDAWKQELVATVTNMENVARIGGNDVPAELTSGLVRGKPGVRRGADGLMYEVQGALEMPARDWGEKIGQAFANGLRYMRTVVKNGAIYMVDGAREVLRAFSPPGPESPLHDIVRWAERTVQSYADAIASARPRVTSAFEYALGGAPGLLSGVAVDVMGRSSASMMVRHEHHITAEGAKALREAGFDDRAVAGLLGAPTDMGPFLSNVGHAIASG